jgi:pimeloyl-ACP methyl ester carboxylesterase
MTDLTQPTAATTTTRSPRRRGWRSVACMLAVAVLAASAAEACTTQARPPHPMTVAGSHVERSHAVVPASPSGASCADYTITVRLAATGHRGWRVWGRLCTRGPSYGGRPVQLLVHGATYDHVYFDWPDQTRNYVHAATTAGYTTLDIDCLGTGNSDHPDGRLLTPTAQANVLHQIITALHDDAFGVAFPRVVLVGHSLGAITAWAEAGTYHDVAALVVSDATHHLNPAAFTALSADKVPANADPRFAGEPWAKTYLTTRPGAETRCRDFYNTRLPGVRLLCAVDERTKSTVAVGAVAAIPAMLADSAPANQVTAPVLDVLGGNDTLFPPAAARHEAAAFDHARSYRQVVFAGSGHALNLQAPRWFGLANQWATHALTLGAANRP